MARMIQGTISELLCKEEDRVLSILKRSGSKTTQSIRYSSLPNEVRENLFGEFGKFATCGECKIGIADRTGNPNENEFRCRNCNKLIYKAIWY